MLSNICTLICPINLVCTNILKLRSFMIVVAKLNCQLLLLCNIRSPIIDFIEGISCYLCF